MLKMILKKIFSFSPAIFAIRAGLAFAMLLLFCFLTECPFKLNS